MDCWVGWMVGCHEGFHWGQVCVWNQFSQMLSISGLFLAEHGLLQELMGSTRHSKKTWQYLSCQALGIWQLFLFLIVRCVLTGLGVLSISTILLYFSTHPLWLQFFSSSHKDISVKLVTQVCVCVCDCEVKKKKKTRVDHYLLTSNRGQ